MVGNSRPPAKFEDVLARCLSAVEQDGASVEQCLAAFPAHVSDLEPLLRAASDLRESPRPVMVPVRVGELEKIIVAHAESALGAGSKRSSSRGARSHRTIWRWATAFSIVLVVVLLAGAGTVAASGSALPGEPIYGIKLASEQVQLVLASDMNKPSLLIGFAEERLEELEALAGEGEVTPEVVEGVLATSDVALNAMEQAPAEQQNELAEKLVSLTERQQEVLLGVLEKAPPQAQPGLQRALEASQHGHERAQQAHSGEVETGPPDHAGPPEGKGPSEENQKGQSKGKANGGDEESSVEETPEVEEDDGADGGKGKGGPPCESPPCDNEKGEGKGKGN